MDEKLLVSTGKGVGGGTTATGAGVAIGFDLTKFAKSLTRPFCIDQYRPTNRTIASDKKDAYLISELSPADFLIWLLLKEPD